MRATPSALPLRRNVERRLPIQVPRRPPAKFPGAGKSGESVRAARELARESRGTRQQHTPPTISVAGAPNFAANVPASRLPIGVIPSTDERVKRHHSPALVVLDDGLQNRVAGRQLLHHSEAGRTASAAAKSRTRRDSPNTIRPSPEHRRRDRRSYVPGQSRPPQRQLMALTSAPTPEAPIRKSQRVRRRRAGRCRP